MAIKATWYDASQTRPVQFTHVVFLFYTSCTHAILIPVSFLYFWCVLVNLNNSTAVFWLLPWDFPAPRVLICCLYDIIKNFKIIEIHLYLLANLPASLPWDPLVLGVWVQVFSHKKGECRLNTNLLFQQTFILNVIACLLVIHSISWSSCLKQGCQNQDER